MTDFNNGLISVPETDTLFFDGKIEMSKNDYIVCMSKVNAKVAKGANRSVAVKEVISEYKKNLKLTSKDDVAKNMKLAATEAKLMSLGLQSIDGKITGNNANFCQAITHLYTKKIEYNEFTDNIEVDRKPVTDFNYSEIYALLSDNLGSVFEHKQKIEDAVAIIAHQNSYHPVKEYLETLEWDGTQRASTMLIHYLGADDSKVNRWMTTMWLYAAVKRIYEPGCKFDNILIMQGAQGAGKSVLCQRLARGKWYAENINIGEKDAYLDMQHSWLIIMDELASMSKKETNDVKNFLSRTEDTYRAPYARNVITAPRHCVFIGSTNEDTFLKDTTSIDERRYWIVKCMRNHKDNIVYKNFTEDVVDQIWAEIYSLYVSDQNIELNMPLDMYEEYKKVQREFKQLNDDPIVSFLDDALNRDYRLNDKGCFDSDSDLMNQYKGVDVSSISGNLHLGKIQRVSSNAIRLLLSDNKFKTYKNTITSYADWNCCTWKYHKQLRINGVKTTGIERISSVESGDSTKNTVLSNTLTDEGLELFKI